METSGLSWCFRCGFPVFKTVFAYSAWACSGLPEATQWRMERVLTGGCRWWGSRKETALWWSSAVVTAKLGERSRGRLACSGCVLQVLLPGCQWPRAVLVMDAIAGAGRQHVPHALSSPPLRKTGSKAVGSPKPPCLQHLLSSSMPWALPEGRGGTAPSVSSWLGWSQHESLVAQYGPYFFGNSIQPAAAWLSTSLMQLLEQGRAPSWLKCSRARLEPALGLQMALAWEQDAMKRRGWGCCRSISLILGGLFNAFKMFASEPTGEATGVESSLLEIVAITWRKISVCWSLVSQ